jgi:hypothetical protein
MDNGGGQTMTKGIHYYGLYRDGNRIAICHVQRLDAGGFTQEPTGETFATQREAEAIITERNIQITKDLGLFEKAMAS